VRHTYSVVAAALAALLSLAAYSAPAWALSTEEEADLVHMRQEEKLARDVYQYLYARHGLALGANIAASEQRHMDAVATVMSYHGVDDPVSDGAAGQFADPGLRQLYLDLIDQGAASAAQALRVGCTIEDLDLYDLAVAQARTEAADILRMYQNLERGSRNHLRAFASALAAYGETYQAQYISQAELEAITGGGNGNNRTGPSGGGNQGGGPHGSGDCDGTGATHDRSGDCDGSGPGQAR